MCFHAFPTKVFFDEESPNRGLKLPFRFAREVFMELETTKLPGCSVPDIASMVNSQRHHRLQTRKPKWIWESAGFILAIHDYI